MKLYELVGRDKNQGFSPFAWRSKLAIAHKALECEFVPLRFTEIKPTLEFAQSTTVPVLVDGDKMITDSWDIVCYLEDAFPDRPSILECRSSAKLFNFQMAMPLLAPLFRTIVADIYQCLDAEDQNYFRSSREKRIGCTIEEAAKDYDASFATFKAGLLPYSQYFKGDDFIGSDGPVYQDFALYGMFLWARATSDKKLIEDDDPITSWIKRMDQSCGGIGAGVKKIK